GPDGLSRRPRGNEDSDDEAPEDVDESIDEILDSGIWIVKEFEEGIADTTKNALVITTSAPIPDDTQIPSNDIFLQRDEDLRIIHSFLENLSFPSTLSDATRSRLTKRAHQFFTRGRRLWRKESNGRHQLVLFHPDRLRILRETHDELGHKGFY
ncbi:hypothetical protein CY34DRAFT_31459, partial [Suillus luteus UH-Slu-Lm8-n1]